MFSANFGKKCYHLPFVFIQSDLIRRSDSFFVVVGTIIAPKNCKEEGESEDENERHSPTFQE